MPPSNNEAILRQRCLPTNQQVEAFLNTFKIENSYDSTIFPLIEISRNNAQPTKLEDLWIPMNFRNDLVNPIVHSSNSDDSWRGMTSDWISPSLMLTMRENDRIHSLYRQFNFNMGKKFNSLIYVYSDFLDTLKKRYIDTLVKSLRLKGYIKVRSEKEIDQEIIRRQAQYPFDNIYLIMGSKIREYYDNMYFNNDNRLNPEYAQVAIIAYDNHNYYNRTNDEASFQHYESAIIASSSIQAAHDIKIEYQYVRQPREWEVSLAGSVKFDIIVDDYNIQQECLVSSQPRPPVTQPSLFKFTDI